ncbi:hypothetical protein [Lysinibacillus fusiformis]|uniref:hypothetical protein n=1 Tax=Lysinibacillus fusiformis TaxID=28031 RepID=UPI0004681AEE|nr:hypothetical protein [Lysinibacillus fusiformis]
MEKIGNKLFANNLEYLLAQEDDVINNIVEKSMILSHEQKVIPPLKANKSANLYDFIQMIGKVVSKAMNEDQVEFVFDEGKRLSNDPNKKIDHPYITYKVLSRKTLMELKPRERESSISEVAQSDKDKRHGRIYGQKFKSYIQFNIIASEYTQADRVMNVFEDLIFSYTHYFKMNGVAEILFEDHLTDKEYDVYRHFLSVRNLVYYVEIEKLHVMFDSDIEGIFIK